MLCGGSKEVPTTPMLIKARLTLGGSSAPVAFMRTDDASQELLTTLAAILALASVLVVSQASITPASS